MLTSISKTQFMSSPLEMLLCFAALLPLLSACQNKNEPSRIDWDPLPKLVITSLEEAKRHDIKVVAEETGMPENRVLSVVVCIPRSDDLPHDLRVILSTHLEEEGKTLFEMGYGPPPVYGADGSHYIASMFVGVRMLDKLYVEMLYTDKAGNQVSLPGQYSHVRLALGPMLESYEAMDYMTELARCGINHEGME